MSVIVTEFSYHPRFLIQRPSRFKINKFSKHIKFCVFYCCWSLMYFNTGKVPAGFQLKTGFLLPW